ncbi:hypothetical protein H5V45_21320 [Nocardioides sp. KIGAM211]|uniref:Glycosyltransferase RgtA/B/C/D-like domain-containing protein n=1 Tax=Nocardioides luti TaxID=2761101 RepID=A0A7X0RKA6_9ACTN|nr:hypothetical protein [Nocardioides luti]MBB6629872.1 hypothetical protein [Nocardioides luti]
MRRLVVPALALLAALARLPFVRSPLSPDEGGLLMVAAQWGPGHSLYGAYWVDRPPLLLALFALAHAAGHLVGDALALRLLGTVAVVVAVLLAGRVGALLRPRGGPLTAALAAALLVSPLVGSSPEVNAELLAVPFVLTGIVALLTARASARPLRWLLLAGAAGAAAVLVKQNEVDVLVLAGPAILAWLPRRRPAEALRHLAALAAGAVLLAAPVLAGAALRGTGPAALWDALVLFRIDASRVIGTSATGTTSARLGHLLVALAVSGVPVLVVGLAVLGRRTRPSTTTGRPAGPAAWPALVLLGWELVSVVAGGSYWLHYLVCLVPGTVLYVGLVAARSHAATVWSRVLVAYAAAVTAVAMGTLALHPWPAPPAADWLAAHAHPGDTAVVAFGHPDILQAAGLSSPYDELWSLPVRVRDPDLTDLTAVLDAPGRPTWVLTRSDLAGWGITPSDGQVALAEHYREVADVDGLEVYRARRTGGDPRTGT